ncbi:DUF222 domain-containing protein [Geodermatophilus sp. SYSU D01186]
MEDVALSGTRGGVVRPSPAEGPVPAVGWASGPLRAVQAADRAIARQTAVRARAVAEFAASRPPSADRAQGEPGAMAAERWAARPEVLRAVSEWAAPELSIALCITAPAAEALLERSLTLVHRLPGTLAALETGVLHAGHLWHLLDKVAPIEDDAVRAEVEAELLTWVGGRSVTTPAQLGDKARRVVLARDARAAARRLAAALRDRGISLRPERAEGMAALTVVCTMPEAQALHRALGACADALTAPGDRRSHGQRMVDCLLDLVLRPGECDLPPVQVLLTVVASLGTVLGGDAPGEVDGQVVPAEVVRALLRGLTGQDTGTGAHTAEPATTAEPAAPAADAVAEPDLRPWQAVDQDELERWWAEMERRVLAEELADLPEPEPEPGDPMPYDAPLVEDAWPDLDDPLEPDDLEVFDAWEEFGDLPDDPAEPQTPETAPPATGQHQRGVGWWAAADRAVDDAGAAVHAAARALGHARRMVRTAESADAADEAAWSAGPAGRITAAPDAIAALAAAADVQRDQLAGLLTATAGGGLADRPRIAVTDALSGALIALTDLPGLRRAAHCGAPACRRRSETCTHDLTGRPALGAPGPTDGYRPGAGLDRFVRTRDRRCRFPGCRRRVPNSGELDHHRPWPEGPTSADNLVGYCTTDHRGKHQATGWRHRLDPDGTLTVTTPSGLTAVTTPPPY